MRKRCHVKCRVFLSDFNGMWTLSTNFWKIFKYQISSKSFQWGPSCSMRTDGHDGGNNFFSKFCECSWKDLKYLLNLLVKIQKFKNFRVREFVLFYLNHPLCLPFGVLCTLLTGVAAPLALSALPLPGSKTHSLLPKVYVRQLHSLFCVTSRANIKLFISYHITCRIHIPILAWYFLLFGSKHIPEHVLFKTFSVDCHCGFVCFSGSKLPPS